MPISLKWRKSRSAHTCVLLRNDALYWAYTPNGKQTTLSGCVPDYNSLASTEIIADIPPNTQTTLLIPPNLYQVLTVNVPAGLNNHMQHSHIEMALIDLIDFPVESAYFLYATQAREAEMSATVLLAKHADIQAQITIANQHLPAPVSRIQFADGTLLTHYQQQDNDTSFCLVLDTTAPRIVVCRGQSIDAIHTLPRNPDGSDDVHPLQRSGILQVCQQYQKQLPNTDLHIFCHDEVQASTWQTTLSHITPFPAQASQIANCHTQNSDLTQDFNPAWCQLGCAAGQVKSKRGKTSQDFSLTQNRRVTKKGLRTTLSRARFILVGLTIWTGILLYQQWCGYADSIAATESTKQKQQTQLNTFKSLHASKKVLGVFTAKFTKQQNTHIKRLDWLGSKNFPGLWLTSITIDKKGIHLLGESRSVKNILTYIKWLEGGLDVKTVTLSNFGNQAGQAKQSMQLTRQKQKRLKQIQMLKRSMFGPPDRAQEVKRKRLQKLLAQQASEESSQLVATKTLSFDINITLD